MTAGLFRQYDLYDGTGTQKSPTLELFESTRANIDMAADYVLAYAEEGGGVRVRVRSGQD